MKAIKAVLIVGGILVLPGILYLVLIKGENHYKRLGIFGPKQPGTGVAAGEQDTVYHIIAGFTLVDQYGQEISGSDLRGRIVIADFFFATCQTICPKMSSQLQRVQEQFRHDDEIVILSHTVNPVKDTAEALLAYSTKYEAVPGKWYFVTGDKKAIYDLARQSYFITAMQGNGGPDDFIHSEKFVLVDKQGRIRGYYDGTDPAEVDRLMDEIKVLKMEYREQQKNQS